jgi:integrase
MTHVELPYIHAFRDRHGRMRRYFRRAGHKRVPLPGLPGSDEFMDAYRRALSGETAPPLPIGGSRSPSGSFNALIAAWYAAPEFTHLAPQTQKTYRRIIDRFAVEHGHRLVRDIEPRHIRKLIASRSATPAQANRLRSLLRQLLQFASEHDWRPDNPALAVRKLKYRVKGFEGWSEEDIAKFEAHWPLGSRARLALTLLLSTGQRRSDVIRMGRQHIRGAAIEVRQQKTGARLLIPLHLALRQAIELCQREHLTFLVTQQGRPFASGNAFYNWFVGCARAAGIAKGLSPHGLRKASARRLAEAGCTPHQIMAITGNRTLAEAQRYTMDAEQEHMARAAVMRLVRRKPPKQ